MKEKDKERDRAEHLMRRGRPVVPSRQLKDRVTSVAAITWGQTSSEIPWQAPLSRLALSAAAALLIVSLADTFSKSLVPGKKGGDLQATINERMDLNGLSATGHDTLVSRLTTSGYRSTEADSLTLHDYLERVREALEEAQPKANAELPASTPGRSRLFPAPSGAPSWS